MMSVSLAWRVFEAVPVSDWNVSLGSTPTEGLLGASQQEMHPLPCLFSRVKTQVRRQVHLNHRSPHSSVDFFIRIWAAGTCSVVHMTFYFRSIHSLLSHGPKQIPRQPEDHRMNSCSKTQTAMTHSVLQAPDWAWDRAAGWMDGREFNWDISCWDF